MSEQKTYQEARTFSKEMSCRILNDQWYLGAIATKFDLVMPEIFVEEFHSPRQLVREVDDALVAIKGITSLSKEIEESTSHLVDVLEKTIYIVDLKMRSPEARLIYCCEKKRGEDIDFVHNIIEMFADPCRSCVTHSILKQYATFLEKELKRLDESYFEIPNGLDTLILNGRSNEFVDEVGKLYGASEQEILESSVFSEIFRALSRIPTWYKSVTRAKGMKLMEIPSNGRVKFKCPSPDQIWKYNKNMEMRNHGVTG